MQAVFLDIGCRWPLMRLDQKNFACNFKIKFSGFGILKSARGDICGCIAAAFSRRQSKHRLIIVRKMERRLIKLKDC